MFFNCFRNGAKNNATTTADLTDKNITPLGGFPHYGKIFFSIIVITSTFAWLIKIKVIRLLLISILFCIYLLNWYSSFFIYPYRISLLIIVSAFFYGILHLYIYNKINKKGKLPKKLKRFEIESVKQKLYEKFKIYGVTNRCDFKTSRRWHVGQRDLSSTRHQPADIF